jgi:predicted  nucleic acid-binding Zn-ribbon protein
MSTPKGYPTQKKTIGSIDGYTELQTKSASNFVTVQPSHDDRVAMDTVARFGVLVDTDAAEAGSSRRVIKATNHVSIPGDYIRITQVGVNQYSEMSVLSTPDADTIILAGELPAAVSDGDTFEIKRYQTPSLDPATGGISTTAGPIQYRRDSVDTVVNEDTSTAANSRPLPVKVLDGSGDEVDFATETTLRDIAADIAQIESDVTSLESKDFATETTLSGMATDLGSLEGKDFATETTLSGMASDIAQIESDVTSLEAKDFATETTLAGVASDLAQIESDITSLEAKDFSTETTLAAMSAKLPAALGQTNKAGSMSVTMASDQEAVGTKSPVNTNGSVINGSLTATTASTENAPANAVGFILQNSGDSSDPIRYRIGGTASQTAGIQLEPARDTGFIPCAANLSICATVSGTNAYELLWILSS